jgi:phosphate transport system ATP-binding protein
VEAAETQLTPPALDDGSPVTLSLRDVSVLFKGKAAVRNVTFDVHANKVTSLIGPSGSGKTTLLRSMNRLHELTHDATVTGQILLDGKSIYDPSIPVTMLRNRIGMVFQRPNPFPTMSIFDNVVAGLRFIGVKDKTFLAESAEKALNDAALWDSVKDRMKVPAATLSGGEQQRLCIARAMAVEPEVLLMDEPTASLDPVSTQQIEELMVTLKQFVTIVIVTHNMQQANRVSDNCAFLLMAEDRTGELIEFDTTYKIFNDPRDSRTLDYTLGRFG